MNLETENLLATMLVDEARRLRQQADKEGVGVYLRNPKVRGRPNSRFLTATVLGVQQANRAVEVNEMWRAREKELELDRRLPSRRNRENLLFDHSKESASSRPRAPSDNRNHTVYQADEDDGLRDEEIEEFLQSKIKRGRGAVGSRMDEPGPYPIASNPSPEEEKHLLRRETKPRILGPEKPSWELLDRETSSKINSVKDSDTKRRLRRRSEESGSSDESTTQKKKDRKRRHSRRSR